MKDTRKKAVALKYDHHKNGAPRVAATGKGMTAENILQKAEEHNVPIVEDSSLVELLGKLDINQTIPEELYQAVAEVFAYIYKTDQSVAQKKRS